jgi:hypothetical protein
MDFIKIAVRSLQPQPASGGVARRRDGPDGRRRSGQPLVVLVVVVLELVELLAAA